MEHFHESIPEFRRKADIDSDYDRSMKHILGNNTYTKAIVPEVHEEPIDISIPPRFPTPAPRREQLYTYNTPSESMITIKDRVRLSSVIKILLIIIVMYMLIKIYIAQKNILSIIHHSAMVNRSR